PVASGWAKNRNVACIFKRQCCRRAVWQFPLGHCLSEASFARFPFSSYLIGNPEEAMPCGCLFSLLLLRPARGETGKVSSCRPPLGNGLSHGETTSLLEQAIKREATIFPSPFPTTHLLRQQTDSTPAPPQTSNPTSDSDNVADSRSTLPCVPTQRQPVQPAGKPSDKHAPAPPPANRPAG